MMTTIAMVAVGVALIMLEPMGTHPVKCAFYRQMDELRSEKKRQRNKPLMAVVKG